MILREWIWETDGQSHRVAIVGDEVVQTSPWQWSRSVTEMPDYLLAGLPLDVQEGLLRYIAARPLAPDASPRDRARTAFWAHVGRIESITRRVVDLPQSMQLRIDPVGAIHGTLAYDGRFVPASRQTWDRFLLDGPEAWQLPLELRRELRSKVLDAIRSAGVIGGLDASNAFPLVDYARIEKGEWEFVDGMRGDFVKLWGDFIEIGGWDNPRDGGSNYRSIESFLRAPNLATGLADKGPLIVARILAARCE